MSIEFFVWNPVQLWCVASTTPPPPPPHPRKMHPNTLTELFDLYTGLQWQIPCDGSDLRRGIELKHIP